MAAAQCVVSNRLHGHILACLLGLPNLLFDNSYGKCSDYFHTWHANLTFARLVAADQGSNRFHALVPFAAALQE